MYTGLTEDTVGLGDPEGPSQLKGFYDSTILWFALRGPRSPAPKNLLGAVHQHFVSLSWF